MTALRIFFRIYGRGSEAETNSKAPSSTKPVRRTELLRSGREVYQFSTMMSIFAQLNDSVQVNELVELYRYVFQGPNNEGILPLAMLNAVMLSGLQDQRHDRVRSTWQLLFESAKTKRAQRISITTYLTPTRFRPSIVMLCLEVYV